MLHDITVWHPDTKHGKDIEILSNLSRKYIAIELKMLIANEKWCACATRELCPFTTPEGIRGTRQSDSVSHLRTTISSALIMVWCPGEATVSTTKYFIPLSKNEAEYTENVLLNTLLMIVGTTYSAQKLSNTLAKSLCPLEQMFKQGCFRYSLMNSVQRRGGPPLHCPMHLGMDASSPGFSVILSGRRFRGKTR